MEYKLKEIVWETTVGCNLRCVHCGSTCEERAKDELSAEEALIVVKQINELNPHHVSLTGGHLMRSDIFDIAYQLSQNGIEVTLVTNGTLITENVAKKLHDSGVCVVSISVDGLYDKHDFIRGSGTFSKIISAMERLAYANVNIGINTTLMSSNFADLEEMYSFFLEHKVASWQLQLGLPEGRLADHRELILKPSEIKKVVNFSLQKNLEGKMKVYLADTIGYFTRNEVYSRMIALNSSKPVIFKGCNAGIRCAGILNNGDVTGCTSIRKPEFIEGNLMKRTLKEIWSSTDSFSWRRNMHTSELGKKCQKCKYIETCMGGCSNIRLIMSGSLDSDNPMCIYGNSI